MELTYHGLSCVRLRGREMTVLVDPPRARASGMGRSAAQLVVHTEGQTDADKLRPGDGHTQEISGPGEFEVGGVSVLGVPAGEVTVMRVEVDDVRVVAAGRLSRLLSEDEIDALGHVDVLVLPVGGGDALGAVDATKLVNAIEPGIVVPARFRAPDGGTEYEPVDKFAKEMGLAEGTWQMVPRLSLSATPGDIEETRVVVLEPRA
jgi:L-ascorbate metabolism protein UlaG (beta-lactamase superfamily)